MSNKTSTYHYNSKYTTKSGEVRLYPVTRKYEKTGHRFLVLDNNDEVQSIFKDLSTVNDKQTLRAKKVDVIKKLKSLNLDFTDKQLDNYYYRRLKFYKI